MTFRSLWAAPALLVLAVPAQSSAAVDPAALSYATQIVETIMPPAHSSEITDTLVRTVGAQVRDAMIGGIDDPGLRQIVDAYVSKAPDTIRPVTDRHMPLILAAMARAYVREFSLDELRQISIFAKTPAGLHYLSRSSALLADPEVAAANRAYFADANQAAKASQDQLRTTVSGYLAKHPDVARKIMERQTP